MVTKLEHLPNELLLEILTYFCAKDLFKSLLNLNTHFNDLIYTQCVVVNLSDSLPKYQLNEYYKSILLLAHSQIHSLELSDTYERLTNYLTDDNQISVDFEIRKQIFSQIKSLTVYDPKSDAVIKILNYLKNIEYLYISTTLDNRCTSESHQEIFECFFKNSSLKQLTFTIYKTMEFNANITNISTSLTYVRLCDCLMKDLPFLLRCIPNIEKLYITCVNPSDRYNDNYNRYDFAIYDALADRIPHLIQLTLRLIGIDFDEVECFLRQLPQLIKLTVTSFKFDGFSNGLSWERVITDCLPKLQKFSLFIDETYIPDYNPIDLDVLIQSFNSLFWHRWPVVIEYYTETVEKKHLLLYTLPIKERQISAYLRGFQIRTNVDVPDWENDKTYYKNLRELQFIVYDNYFSGNLLPKRNYPKLEILTFSFKTRNSTSYQINSFIADFQQVLSTSTLAQIERIYINDENCPVNFLPSILKILPNVTNLHLSTSSFHLSDAVPLIKHLAVRALPNIHFEFKYILRQITKYLSSISSLDLELENTNDIYILLPYCIRTLSKLTNLQVAINESSPPIDRQSFLSWFDNYRQLNGMDDYFQVEFNDTNHRLLICL